MPRVLYDNEEKSRMSPVLIVVVLVKCASAEMRPDYLCNQYRRPKISTRNSRVVRLLLEFKILQIVLLWVCLFEVD